MHYFGYHLSVLLSIGSSTACLDYKQLAWTVKLMREYLLMKLYVAKIYHLLYIVLICRRSILNQLLIYLNRMCIIIECNDPTQSTGLWVNFYSVFINSYSYLQNWGWKDEDWFGVSCPTTPPCCSHTSRQAYTLLWVYIKVLVCNMR